MDRKRRFCEHCNDFVNDRTYRLHRSLYYDPKNQIWQLSGELSSDEDSNNDDGCASPHEQQYHFEVYEDDESSTSTSAEPRGT